MNKKDLLNLYQLTLEQLKKGERPQLHLSEEELEFLTNHWSELLRDQAPEKDFFPLLLILDHTKSSSTSLRAPLIKTLLERKEPDLLVYTLSASLKVILEDCEKKGERVPYDFIKSLPTPLDHKSPEVVEWTLRVIEQLGHQSIILKDEVLKRKPGVLALFNQHKKNAKEIIELLEKRWLGKGL